MKELVMVRKTNSLQIRCLLISVFILATNLLKGQEATVGVEALRHIEQASTRGDALFAVCVWKVGQKDPLVDFNAHQQLTPASITKVVTTASALSLLGTDFCYSTEISISGEIVQGTLMGNLIVTGSGDPSIWSRKLKQDSTRLQELILDALAHKGIKKIVGKIVVDASLWCPEGYNPTWAREDHGDYYAAPVYAFNCFDNHVDLFLKAEAVGGEVSIYSTFPEDSGIEFINNLKSASKENLFTDGDGLPLEERRVLRGVLRLGENDSMAVDMPNPPLFAARFLHRELAKRGVDVSECLPMAEYRPLKGDKQTIARYLSPSLEQICSLTNYYSINPFAEALIRTLATHRQSKEPCHSTSSGLYLQEEFLRDQAKINLNELRLYDGCGLSLSNRIAPYAMCGLLQYMMQTNLKTQEAFVASLPRVGYDGTVKKLMPRTKFDVRLKSGYMKGVRTYAGYIYRGEEKYAVCMMANKVRNASKVKETFTRFLSTFCRELEK